MAMTAIEYQIPLHLPGQTCWLDCDPHALSQLVMVKLGSGVFDKVALSSFLVANPVWMLLSLEEISNDPAKRGKCRLSDVHQWLIKTERLTDLRARQAKAAKDSNKVSTKTKIKARKTARRFTKRLALVESADDLKATLARLVNKPHRKTVMENLSKLRIAKSFWKAIRQAARANQKNPGNSRKPSQQPDYAAIFTRLSTLEKTSSEFDEQLLTQKLDSMRSVGLWSQSRNQQPACQHRHTGTGFVVG